MINFSAPTYRRESGSRLGFIIFQFWHLALIATVGQLETYTILIFSGIVNVVSYSFLLLREIRAVNHISPLHLYLLTSIFRMGVSCIYIGFLLQQGYEEVIQIGPITPMITDYLVQGHMILMVGDMAFLLGYWLIKNRGESNITRNFTFDKTFSLSFRMAILLLLFKFIDMQFSFTDSRLFHYLLTYGTPGCLYVMLKSFGASKGQSRRTKALMISIVTGVMIIFALRSYMKSDLLIVLLPFIIIFLEKYRRELKKLKVSKSIFRILPLFLILYFFVVTMTTYSETRRTFIGNDQYAIDRAESVEVIPFLITGFMASIPGTEQFERFNSFPSGGAWHFLKRLSVTNLGAWAYKEVQDFGYWDRSFFKDLLVSIVPRVLWPNKPDFWPGRIFASKVGHADSPETATTSTALTMAASFYWWGGIVAVIIGMSISGLLVAAAYRFVQNRQTSNPMAALVTILLLYSSLMWYEGAFYGTIQLMLYLFIVFIPLIIVFERLALKRY